MMKWKHWWLDINLISIDTMYFPKSSLCNVYGDKPRGMLNAKVAMRQWPHFRLHTQTLRLAHLKISAPTLSCLIPSLIFWCLDLVCQKADYTQYCNIVHFKITYFLINRCTHEYHEQTKSIYIFIYWRFIVICLTWCHVCFPIHIVEISMRMRSCGYENSE